MSFDIVSAGHVMALRFRSVRLGVGRQMISKAVHVMLVSLFLLEMVRIVKKPGGKEQKDELNFAFVNQQDNTYCVH